MNEDKSVKDSTMWRGSACFRYFIRCKTSGDTLISAEAPRLQQKFWAGDKEEWRDVPVVVGEE